MGTPGDRRRRKERVIMDHACKSTKPSLWALAVLLSVVNLAGAGFAVGQAEPQHAAIHVGVALAFGLWARRLRWGPRGSDYNQARLELDEETRARLAIVDQLESRVSELENR